MTKDGRTVQWKVAEEAANSLRILLRDIGFTAPELQGQSLAVAAELVTEIATALCLLPRA